MKKLLALLLAMTIVMALVACGGNNGQSNDTPPATQDHALFTARKGKHAHSEASHTQSGKPCKFPLIHNTYPPKRASANIIL